MSDPCPARLHLELFPGSEPIRGRISHDGQVWSFTGWLALARAIDEAKRSVDRAADAPGGGAAG